MAMKKLLAALLALILLFSAAAFAETDAAEGADLAEGEAEFDAEGDAETEYDEDDDEFLEALLETDIITIDDYAVTEDLPDDWWNILLLGTDNRYTKANYHGRTDSMIILSINPGTHQAKLASIMRDTWVQIQGHGGCKINAACVYGGPALTMRVINENFGMNITDYVLINITGLADVIDRIGGLDLNVTEAERKALNKGLFDLSSMSGMEQLKSSGEGVHLNGNQAVAFARIRKIDTDYRRTERQREVLTAMARKLKAENNAFTLISVVNTLLPFVETNLEIGEIMTLASVGLQLDLDNVDQIRLPVPGSSKDGMYQGTWMIRADFSTNRKKLYQFIYGD